MLNKDLIITNYKTDIKFVDGTVNKVCRQLNNYSKCYTMVCCEAHIQRYLICYGNYAHISHRIPSVQMVNVVHLAKKYGIEFLQP